ncbi:YafY family transcriptional regulator [Cronobacter malonaticus]|uniref:helix-turn-helix transcriptional regulator n=1 Tax=Cronobacter malonaticus TaxID=413503 RepID=UPI000518DC3F|nr:YafY family protein [Cronobacter malonaticus]EGT4373436.1 YafY family transcriptional regulator [Cronobacter malonaticus]ELY6230702.1 YafY family transcriptional regulator [Cronobacter malonaticus]MDI6467213.1 YafY family protein [Cronobacter malonaticus]MDK1177931.1 YafY family protein [Cronobacter malonaticus]MDK1685477.1 YafY family protein [Cronobacter malonaticus]
MTRIQRLLELLQLLRSHRYPVTAATLAERLDVSVRSIYRDIETLKMQGVEIEGSAGIGYILQSDYHLPPLMFDAHEVDALMLGLHWVMRHTDPQLEAAARNAVAKIHAILPENLAQHIRYPSLMVPPPGNDSSLRFLADIRQAIHQRRKLELVYTDKDGAASSRLVWPIALGFFDAVRMLACWCELRQAFRHFRIDRMQRVTISEQSCPQSRYKLLKEWKNAEGIEQAKTY